MILQPPKKSPVSSTTNDGLMSSADKIKLNNSNIAYGTCSTAAATAAKVVSISGNTKWTLTAGSIITIKFTYTNTASNPTLNVNGTGAKPVFYNGAVITSGSRAGYANRYITYVYDGTNFVWIGQSIDENNTYSAMTGATSSAAGKSGLVPAPAAGKQASFLRGDGTWVVPTDTKVTNTLNTTAKAYVTGTTSSSTNTGTQVFDTGVYLDTTAGMLTATTFKGALSGNASTSNKLKSSSYTTISINTSDWTTNPDGGYVCTKTLSSAMAYTNFNFDVVLSTDQAAAKLQIEAWNCVIADGNITQTTSNGSTTAFTFYAFTTKPSVALTIAVQGVS